MLHFLARARKRKQRKKPVFRFTLRVAENGRSTRNLASLRPACGKPLADKQSARFCPAASPMLSAGQRGIQNLKLNACFQAPFEGAS